jgi:hypothetical protein
MTRLILDHGAHFGWASTQQTYWALSSLGLLGSVGIVLVGSNLLVGTKGPIHFGSKQRENRNH